MFKRSLAKQVLPETVGAPGQHCFYASLHALLLRQGVYTDEADLYFLCNGLSISYKGNFDSFGLRPMADLLSQWSTNTQVEVKHVTIDPSLSKRNDFLILQDWSNALENGKSILLHLQSHCLNFHPVYQNNPSKGHVIQLYGLDMKQDEAYVSDHFLLEESGHVLSYSGKTNLTLLLEGISEYAYLNGNPAEELSVKKVIQACDLHLEQFLQESWSAYAVLFCDLDRLLDMDDEQFRANCDTLYYQLRIESLMHLLQYTEQFISRYEGLMGGEHYTDLLRSDLYELRQTWKRHLLQLYKIGLRVNRDKLPEYIQHSLRLLAELKAVLERMRMTVHQVRL
ncbi:BtrH N-terminal domain-containing protein [Paenibacillus sp. PsM32]|uniref:BtrH N-terminal domain-containing protein n=1 Tax=Paenibacillus sp. PsM32 TaxID=3030536 RepID=UPI00263B9BC2|nr:BtrH N-terminal domain-containing protein [Paenibacillus sp. PsM32]MDN4616889.1 BtrH N-terminal domain-containing protein [Paenibacillus sp. PsM32]